MVDSKKDFSDSLFDFSTQMAAATLTVVAILFVVIYDFKTSGALTEASQWLVFAHYEIYAVMGFSFSGLLGLVYKIPKLSEKYRKYLSYGMIALFVMAWVILMVGLAWLIGQTK